MESSSSSPFNALVTTALSQVDGAASALSFRGVSVEALADRGYVAVASFLHTNRWPDVEEVAAFEARLLEQQLPAHAVADTTMAAAMASLRRSLTDVEAGVDDDIAAFAGAVSRLVGRLRGHTARRVDFVGAILEGVSTRSIDDVDVAAFDAAMVLHLDHALNPGTLCVRVAASTGASAAACLTAGLTALEGPLHGGASTNVGAMLERLVSSSTTSAPAIEQFVLHERAAKRRLPGFGHPIYQQRDPRTAVLKKLTEGIANATGDSAILDVASAVEAAVAHTTDGRLFANVDFYAAALYASLGIPLWLHTPMFAAARLQGWAAHVVEERARRKIISPEGGYCGPPSRSLHSVINS
jgi:citrate synthase